MRNLTRAFSARVGLWTKDSLSSAILMREAARTSRRWQTHAARLGFSGMLIGGLLLAIWVAVEAPFADKADLGWLGRGLFIGIATLQFGMAILLAPLMCAAALIEESDQGTLDLLVLTRLKSSQVVTSKVLSRILILLTLVFGALPVTATVVTLGGVSGIEVVAVTAHTAVGLLLSGAMGAMFAQYTRSPLLAMIAAAAYAVPAYVVLPLGYAMLSVSPRAMTHLSLLGGPGAQGPDALLAAVAHLPVIALVWWFGTRLFALRTTQAHHTAYFSKELWQSRRAGYAIGLFVMISCPVLFLTGTVLWGLRIIKIAWPIGLMGTQTVLFLWAVIANLLAAWVYLRVVAEVVDAIDRAYGRGQAGGDRQPVKVWPNPVAWREARPRAWGTTGVPIQFTWLLGLLLLSQSTLWMIPGGLLGLGLANLTGAVLLTLWLATWTMESERRLGSLEVLLTTTLPSWRIALGKAAGIALPTAPLVVISLPMLLLGSVWANVFFDEGGNPLRWLAHGLGAWVWASAVWMGAISLGMLVALRSRKRSAFALSVATLATMFGVPAMIGRLFPDTWWLAGPARLLAPPLAGDPALWQTGLSTLALAAVAVGLFAFLSTHLRRWASLLVVVLGLGLALPVDAQELEPQDDFVMLARPIADGLVREGEWTSVQVSILNLGNKATGTLELTQRNPGSTEPIPYRREVELPEGARKDVNLLIRPGTGSRDIPLQLTTLRRFAETEVQLQVQPDSAVLIGIIGDHPLGINALDRTWSRLVPGTRPRKTESNDRAIRAGLIDETALPRHAAAYNALDLIVWSQADPTRIGATELDTLLSWVAAGGHLVLSVTDTWRAVSDSPLGEALTVDLVGTRDAQDLHPLMDALSVPRIEGGAPQALAVPGSHPDRATWVLAEDDDGYALWSIGTYGLGTITVLTVDPSMAPLYRAPDLWRSLLWLPRPDDTGTAWWSRLETPDRAADPATGHSLAAALRVYQPETLQCHYGDDTHEFADFEYPIRSRLSDIPGASPLPLSWLILFSGLYLLAIGPLDFFVLRWLGREPWTWVTFPLTVVVFSAAALVGTAYTKGSQAVVTRVEVIDVLPGTDRWRGHTAIGVFSTRKTWLSLTSGSDDGVMAPLKEPGFMNDIQVISHQGPGQLKYRAETWTLAYARSTWVTPRTGRIRQIQTEDETWIDNALGVDLTHVVLVQPDPSSVGSAADAFQLQDLGPLARGDRAQVHPDAWRLAPPTDELAWAWSHVREMPEAQGGHLHLGSHDRYVLAVAEAPVESVALSGLSPVERNYTVFRIPLGPPKTPSASTWKAEP